MAFSLGLLGLFPRETCLASGISEEGSAGKSRGGHKFSVFQRVAEKQMVRLSSKGDDLSSLEDDSVKSANFTRESKLHKDKTSYNGEGNFSAMNPRKHSSSEEQGETGDVKSKSASLKFKSTLQDILNDFRSSERPSVPPRKKASSRSGIRSENDSRTAGLKAHRNVFWNLSGQASLDAWKDHAVSEETDLSFDDSSNVVASENVRENMFTMAKSQRFSSVIKSNIPIGKADTGASTQNGNGPPRRPSRSNGSWSRSPRSSTAGRSLTDSWTSDSKGGASCSSTSTSVSSSSPKQLEALFKPRERIKSHNFLELDGENEKHQSSDDFHTAALSSRSSSSASSQESRTQISLQSMGTSSFESLSDLGVEHMEDFSFKASSDSVVEDGVENGSFKSPMFLGVTSGTSLPEQVTSNSGVKDDVVDGSPISTSGVGSNSMSLPENLTSCSGERVFDSTTFLDSNLDDSTRSVSENKADRCTPSHAVTKQGTFSSLPVSSSRFNHALGVESGSAHDSSPSGLAVSQDSVKTRPVWNHPLSDLPFELQYSYSETPNAPIKGLRWGHQFSPFGPTASGRPWTGGAPLKPSKKKLPEFDSFKPPPRGKKGVKYVQDPGPYPKDQGPQPAKSREEIIGEPLSQEEVVLLVEKCLSDNRQVNLGRDGLTHNMLDVIHSHWKRRRVCKIKCIGVPTVDMDNVCFHVEDKTGGKIIYRTGGVLYLFRGRNYNYKDRPRIPLMLWKPATPIYPKLIEKTPGGLKEEQANQLRALCQKIDPLCKLGKNGIYLNLVNDVRFAFKVDDLVRIDCQGLNPSDYKKLGAKLKDLVPCVLLSFENEQILLWKGKDVNASSLVDTDCGDVAASVKDKPNFLQEPTSVDGRCMDFRISNIETSFQSNETQSSNSVSSSSHAAGESISSAIQGTQLVSHLVDTQAAPDSCYSVAEDTISITSSNVVVSKNPQRVKEAVFEEIRGKITGSAQVFLDKENLDKVDILSEHTVLLESLPQKENDCSVFKSTGKEENVFSDIELRNEGQIKTCSGGVDVLWEQAVESGMAIELDETDLDMDSVLKKADELAHIAPPGPAYTRSLVKKLQLRVKERTADEGTEVNLGRIRALMKKKKAAKRVADLRKEEVPQRGALQVDELAGLLA